MKKSLFLVAILSLATTLFAETISCESEKGKCTYELSEDYNLSECVCRDGSGEESTSGEGTELGISLPTEEECMERLEIVCHNVFGCENKAGECTVGRTGYYECTCFNTMGEKTGKNDAAISEEGCQIILVEACGTELASLRTACSDENILDTCVLYEQTLANTCFEPVTNEDLEALIDVPIASNATAKEIAKCCNNSAMRKEKKASFECIEAAESCENKECCSACNVGGEDSAEEDKEDAANTEAPTTGTTPEGTADGDSAPATDSEATAEKEESKSDGCSMLFS